MRFRERWRGYSLHKRLVLLLALVMMVCQMISIVWVWHESQEQVEKWVKRTLQPGYMNRAHNREQREIIGALLVPNVLMTGLALGLASLVITWLTMPLADLVRLLNQRSASNLKPLALNQSGSEIDTVVLAINDLLARLDLSVTRERQFSADVAHELRTPLAGIRLSLELMAQQGQRGTEPLVQRLDSLNHTIEQLLQLARLERKLIIGESEQLDWSEQVILPLLPELERMLARRGQSLQLYLSPATMYGDITLLQLLVRNLVENCARYADADRPVTLSIASISGEQPLVRLVMEDEGPGVDESKIQRLTEPYVRLDQRGNGSGLGLNIVARVCHIHQASLQFINRSDRKGLRICIELPQHLIHYTPEAVQHRAE